ncbi:arylsulfotransferase family protein [Aspergillus clavatus NRRL 1]|uniref:Arylsulfotransferase n=1 Tax=Aspergillus clavatus (strain ATCC 1007 / CBS 513.65 / DSM 816 / NCTC 3887 / NRRL 1 / QM 1276 / 107) TaxID=344612 RepID=A1CB52_ASPCL|nr:uncharacterized protein ACLA_014070 [Aspergillus clavatus NRRL 1]EAW12970.1 conserved hypothetical protein [Aspergillus clavatus NRRL 1]
MRSPEFLNLFHLIALLAGGLCVSAKSIASAASVWPLQTFRSTPITAPYMNVTKNGKTEPGYLFISPYDLLQKTGHPMIYADDGELVWHGPLMNVSAFQPQMLDGEPVLAYWDGYLFTGFGFGGITILNSSYQEIHRVTLSGDDEKYVTIDDSRTYESYLDVHESQITDQGTILVTAVNVTQMDLSSIGGPKDGWVQDSLFYEIDIKTNKVLFRWSTVEHVSEVPLSNAVFALGDTGHSKDNPYKYPHLNSVAKYGDSYLISSRLMCSIFLIDKNGNVTWTLHGQTGGDFKLGPGTRFCYQHDLRFIAHTEDRITLHLHNNENTAFTTHPILTTGLILELDMQNRTVSLLKKFWDAEDPVFAPSQGSYQSLPNGHVLMEHGAVPKLEEYDENGAVVMRARFGYDYVMNSYRGYRSAWTGRPNTKPDVLACPEQGGMAVYVSWNGATDVQSWKVMTGSAEDKLSAAQIAPKNGFETKVWLDKISEKVTVEAVGGVGHGTKSEVVTVGQGC